jgi:hypothetical protein
MGLYRKCKTKYKSGPKKGKCKDFVAVRGRKKKARKPQKRWCIRWRKTKPKTCTKFGTRVEAKRAGVL